MRRFISTTLTGLMAVFILSDIGFIQVGHISKIDAKHHTVMMLVPKDPKDDQAPLPSRGGFGRGRFGSPLPGDIARQMQRSYETKVFVNAETIFKDSEGMLHFGDLAVGDFVEVEGVMHGNDFQAKQFLRHAKKSDLPKNQ